MNRARTFGQFVANSNLSLLNTTAQFLGGIKLAVSQNLQNSFVAEFQDTLKRLTERQIAFTRLRSRTSLISTTLFSLIAAVAMLIGFGVLDIAPPVLFTMLYLLSRVWDL